MRTPLVVAALLALSAPAVAGVGSSADANEEPTLWNTLLFDAWTWVPGGIVGFGGVALWALIILAGALVRFKAPLRPTVQVAGAATAFVTVWALLPQPGAMTEIGLPALAGLAAAWFLVNQVKPTLDVLQALLVATIVGAFAGDILAYAIRSLVTDPGILVFGNRRFVDQVFTLPGFAVAGFLLFKVIPELVHALDDDSPRAEPAERGPMQGDTFQVRCLRCQTDIKVDRSMKRFRVATDRFEFACPNCQSWMEWADPGQKNGAAAA